MDLRSSEEISQALKEFEADSKFSPIPQKPVISNKGEVPTMVRWVMKISGGAITEQKQAEYVLLGFVILAILISVFLFFSNSPDVPLPPPTPFEENNL